MAIERTCACPRSGARDCHRFRYRLDIRDMIDGGHGIDDDEVCECPCHDPDPDDDDSC